MQGKRVSESMVVMPQRMLPQDANPAGNVFGGVVLKHIDLTGATAAMRHSRKPVVTASIDRMDFLGPAHVGELMIFTASVNLVGKTSMEVGVRIEAEHLITGQIRHTGSCYLTYVALGEDGRPSPVPPLILENEEQERRNREAQRRRVVRLRERQMERDSQSAIKT